MRRTYHGLALGIAAVIGYMLTEFAHYGIFQRPKSVTPLEWLFLVARGGALGELALYFFL